MTRVMPPNLELWLTGYVRALAAAEGVDADVDNKEPPGLTIPMVRPLVVIRDDSGPRRDHTTFDRAVGVTVLGGSRLFAHPIMEVARWLSGVLNDDAIVFAAGSQIAAVDWDRSNGPFLVPEVLDVARIYQTAGYVVSGSW